MDISSLNLKNITEFATNIAKKCSQIIEEAKRTSLGISTKTCSADLVTEVDIKVEKFIRDSICEAYPSHRFIGEESYKHEKLTDHPTWIVDPIDGTTNFVHQFPYFCISIGLVYKKESVVGVIYNPTLNHMYTAYKGGGAYCNEEPITVSKTKELSLALLMTEFGSSRDPHTLQVKMQNFHELLKHCHGIRCLGSAAMNMCAVACGSADAYLEYSIHCWDMAAAAVIIKEAGGYVMDPTDKEFDLMSRRILCGANMEICRDIMPHLTHLHPKRDDSET